LFRRACSAAMAASSVRLAASGPTRARIGLLGAEGRLTRLRVETATALQIGCATCGSC
jgi:hypothetical protein